MFLQVKMFRWVGAVALLLSVVMLAAACGSDPDPTATPVPPTATPIPPTATPTSPPPTDTPEPVEQPDAMNSLEELVITPATTGGELIDALSEEETDCIKEAIGESFFGLMVSAPLMQATGNPEAAAPIFGCISEENLVLLGVAFMEAQSGGWEASTRECITEIGREHPDAIYVRLGIAYQGDSDADAGVTNVYNLQIYNCMTSEEKRDQTLALWIGLDRNSQHAGAEIVSLLSEDELACVTEDLSGEEMAAVAAATPLVAITLAGRVSYCIEPDTNVEIFVKGIEWALADFSEDSLNCLRDFARELPEYMHLVQSGIDNMMSMDADEFVAITDAGVTQYGCMTAAELEQVQIAFTDAMTAATQ